MSWRVLAAVALVSIQPVSDAAAQQAPLTVRTAAMPPSSALPFVLDTIRLFDGSSAADSADAEPFGVVASIATDASGRIAILDFTAGRVTVFDLSGRRLGSLGRDGDGPGEFRLPTRIAFDRERNLYVFDQFIGRVSVFDSALRFVRAFNLTQNLLVTSFIVTEDAIALSGVTVSGPAGMRGRSIHLFSREDGQYQRSFGHGLEGVSPQVARYIGGGSISIARGGGFWYSQVAPYLIERYGSNGTLELRIERPNSFLPSATQAITVAVGDSGVSVATRPHPRAIAVLELGDTALLQQVNLMNGEMVGDFYRVRGARGAVSLQRAWRGRIPALLHPVPGARDLFVALLGGGDEPHRVGILRLRMRR
ncbi:MAG TPA: 6-bladed beta-propeller [Gemmatimonadales bacterium]|nr:6-bladed beta-propeller [Gemmatimonadales bacterium]